VKIAKEDHATATSKQESELGLIRTAVEANPRLLIGGHVSVAGGVHRAIERGENDGFTAIQVFTRNPTQWQSPPLTDEKVDAFRTAWKHSIVQYVVAHDSYLINLATPDAALRKKSIDAMLDEIDRAEVLGIGEVVTHLGAHMGADEDAGIANLVASLNTIHEQRPDSRVRIALETTAGQGTSLGYRFEHLAAVFDGVDAPERLVTCFDTCHVWVAGNDLAGDGGFDEVWSEFDRIVGIERLCCIHVNDAKRERGSRVDRHAHIGEGTIADDAFRRLMRSDGLSSVPKIVETSEAETHHRTNVAHLVSLLHS